MFLSSDTIIKNTTGVSDSAAAALSPTHKELHKHNNGETQSGSTNMEGIPTIFNNEYNSFSSEHGSVNGAGGEFDSQYGGVNGTGDGFNSQYGGFDNQYGSFNSKLGGFYNAHDSTAINAEINKQNNASKLSENLIANRLGFFSDSPWAKDSFKSYFVGVSGDLVPYKLGNDTFVTGTLLICLLLACFVIGRSLRPLALQIKSFFRFKGRNEDFSLLSEKSMNGGVLVVLLESFVISLLFFSYAEFKLTDTFTTTSPYLMLLADIGICLLYFLFKTCCYKLVNWTFFRQEERQQWLNGYNLVAFGKAVTLLPLAMIVLYFDLPIRVCIVGCLTVIAVYELLIFYKTRQIFFALPLGTIPAFLYFCTLELLPLFFLWEMLVKTSRYLAS